MYPFFYLAYRGKNINEIMDFKRRVWSLSAREYHQFYNELDSISRDRETDLNKGSLKKILDSMDPSAHTLLDVGCGHGYFLRQVRRRYPAVTLVGTDIKTDTAGGSDYMYVRSNIEKLPFPDKSFDVVTCNHTIEHLLDIQACVGELIRVARRQVIVATPRQRYHYFTLDEHLNFFPDRELLVRAIPLLRFSCEEIRGDWLYVGRCD